MSLLQKTVHYRGEPAETAAGLNANCGFWCVVTGGGELPPIEPIPYFESIRTFENNFESIPKKLKTDEERAVLNLESTPKEPTRTGSWENETRSGRAG